MLGNVIEDFMKTANVNNLGLGNLGPSLSDCRDRNGADDALPACQMLNSDLTLSCRPMGWGDADNRHATLRGLQTLYSMG
ncbi:hypothetical protein LVO79_16765 [Roseivivax marinus]|uniref:hypothetical protein n=1 Tax=Roseivivax marinus TaxID=1379903 RepID=UPI001F04491D|nr:hypothetical protein [Roseivivax marinus]UMA64631.1 hypothetical protein LVO79_16765 [Roseivivax marinus]